MGMPVTGTVAHMSVRSCLSGLIALLLLVAACGSEVTLEGAGNDGDSSGNATGTGGDSADGQTGTDPTTAPTELPTPAPTEPPTPEPTLEPTPLPTPAVDVGLLESVVLSGSTIPEEVEDCLIRELLGNSQVVQEVGELGPTADYQNLVPEPGPECLDADVFANVLVEGFLEGIGDTKVALGPEVEACFSEEFADPEDRKALIAVGLTDDEISPENAVPLIDVMVECLPGDFYADLFEESLAQQADLGLDGIEVFDRDCIAATFDDPSFSRGFLNTALESSNGSGAEFSPQEMAPLLNCIAFGRIMQSALAGEGIVISDDSAACIDEESRTSGLIDTLIDGGEPTEDEVAGLFINCLSAEELVQVGGS